MKPKLLGIATLLVLISCASSGSKIAETVLPITNQNNGLEKQTQEESQEQAFQLRRRECNIGRLGFGRIIPVCERSNQKQFSQFSGIILCPFLNHQLTRYYHYS